jgi:hypothetical protein
MSRPPPPPPPCPQRRPAELLQANLDLQIICPPRFNKHTPHITGANGTRLVDIQNVKYNVERITLLQNYKCSVAIALARSG